MNDKELLELAAKAAGIEFNYERWKRCGNGEEYLVTSSLPHKVEDGRLWNPLTDDGDALRLVVKLGLHVFSNSNLECSFARKQDGPHIEEEHGSDEYAATRRAIVRAAAEIGKSI